MDTPYTKERNLFYPAMSKIKLDSSFPVFELLGLPKLFLFLNCQNN